VPPLRGTNGEMGKEASSSGVVDIILIVYLTSSSHNITSLPSSKLRIPCSISHGLCGPRRGGS
jgi:hypothetical protein